ncbi:MAG: phosphatidate cytidylyltransferase [Ruminococcus sp.]|nr:phosphatidate cytidylyltransferase [Ruminococcus sp.]
MLTRIISAAAGIAILAVVLVFHSTIVLPIAVAVMIAIMLYELLCAVKLHTCIPILVAIELCGISMPLIYSKYYVQSIVDYVAADSVNTVSINGDVTLISFAVTLAAAFVIFLTWLKKHNEIRYEQVFFAIAVMILVPQAMTTMVRIERYSPDNGLFLLIIGLCGAWIADAGAYFTGVTIGKHKLCPEISLKKTIEGFVGGLVITGLAFVGIFALYVNKLAKTEIEVAYVSYIAIFALGVICAVIGTIGDLSASLVKRQCGIKDYGKIMPGHGGLMDRFDSVLFVLPTFYAFVSLTGIVE